VVTHQLQVERRTGKVRQSETDVLPLCNATNVPKTVVNSHSVTAFKSRLRYSSSPGFSLFPFLSSTLPGPSASEVTTMALYKYDDDGDDDVDDGYN